MIRKILFISNTANFSKFNRPFMRWFKEQNWQVDYVSAGEEPILDCDHQYAISIKRNPFNVKNIKAYKELKEILLHHNYDIIHCHTPMGSVLGRLAAKSIKTPATLIYTAHGFHFYSNAPTINWLVYYPIEKYFAKYTDMLITINNEDYNIAKRKFLSCKNIYKLNGLGVDLSKFGPCSKENKNRLRENFGVNKSDFVILYVAEFIQRKNHCVLIKSINSLKKKIKPLKIIFAGIGPKLDKYRNKIEAMGISETVQFLGYRHDIEVLCNIADIGISTSTQEGLPISVIEYIVSGLPVVCSRIRGHTDIITNRENGLLFDLDNLDQLVDSINDLYGDENLRDTISQNNLKIREKYSLDTTIAKMAEIYANACKTRSHA